MKSLLRFLIIALALSTIVIVSPAKPANAATGCVVASGSNPPSTSVTFDALAGHVYAIQYSGPANFYFVLGSPPVNIPGVMQPIPAGFTLAVLDLSASCPATTFYNPGDARLDGRPGDRLAVYCNTKATPPNIEVYAIAPGGQGRSIAVIRLADLINKNIVRNLGINGTLRAGIDGNGNGYVALQGGQYNATNGGDWSKTFTCKA